jgi:hypothetical protein
MLTSKHNKLSSSKTGMPAALYTTIALLSNNCPTFPTRCSGSLSTTDISLRYTINAIIEISFTNIENNIKYHQLVQLPMVLQLETFHFQSLVVESKNMAKKIVVTHIFSLHTQNNIKIHLQNTLLTGFLSIL